MYIQSTFFQHFLCLPHVPQTVDDSSEEDVDHPMYTLEEKIPSPPSEGGEEEGRMDTSVTDSKSLSVTDGQDSELSLDALQAHSNAGSPNFQPLGDITNITSFPDVVVEATDCPQSTEKNLQCYSSEDSSSPLANTQPRHSEIDNSSAHTVDLTGKSAHTVTCSCQLIPYFPFQEKMVQLLS